MTILIADDDADQLAIRGILLRQNGFKTLEATDASSALRLATAEHPSCAVIDLRLPTEELGLQLIRELKAVDPSMHVFVLTGLHPGCLAHRSEKNFVDEILLKGSSSASLIRKLKALANVPPQRKHR